MFMRLFSGLMISAAIALAFASVGCNQPAKSMDAKAKSEPMHDGWWCQEHGIPEHLCSLCSEEFAAKAKKEGDWCKLHDRAQSQCFKCDPSKYKTFEDMYVAKYNKKPERPPESEFTR